jgi:hypothetical protein
MDVIENGHIAQDGKPCTLNETNAVLEDIAASTTPIV